jgi:ribosomal-protein-alanine N-acetyltransferase
MINKDKIVLNESFFYLRILTDKDYTNEYKEWLNDSDINQYLETRHHIQDENSIKTFLKQMHQSDDSYLFGIFANKGDQRIGNIKLGPIHQKYFCADISYFIGNKTYQGKGIATKAINLILKFAFEILNLHKIKAVYYISNKASKKCLLKNGFKIIGTFREEVINVNGQREDTEKVECLKVEWQEKND